MTKLPAVSGRECLRVLQKAGFVLKRSGGKPHDPPIGALASFGIDVGGPSRVEDLETLFRSNDLTARVFRNHTQIGKTVDALTRDRLYFLYGQEV